MNNPFQPPRSGFEKPPRDREPGSLFAAVLIGVAIDIGGTIVSGEVMGGIYQSMLTAQGLSDMQIKEIFHTLDPFSVFSVLGMMVGMSMSIMGGFFCARTANVNSYTAIGILSAISVTFGTLMSSDRYEWVTLLMLNLLGLVCNFIGGWWFIRRLDKEA